MNEGNTGVEKESEEKFDPFLLCGPKQKAKKTVRLTQFKPMQEELLKIRLENAACLAALKELIPIAEKAVAVTDRQDYQYKSAIERAKRLTDGK